MYRGKSDWKFIKKVKDVVNIPVIGNGDIENINDVDSILKLSSVDGLMIGRGVYGKPWIFEEINAYLNKKKFLPPNIKEINNLVNEHLQLSIEHYGPNIGLKNFRKHLGWYSKSLKNSNTFRHRINQSLDLNEIRRLINSFFIEPNF